MTNHCQSATNCDHGERCPHWCEAREERPPRGTGIVLAVIAGGILLAIASVVWIVWERFLKLWAEFFQWLRKLLISKQLLKIHMERKMYEAK